MSAIFDKKDLELICIIVNSGLGSKVMARARQNGITGGTVCLGKGTVPNRLLDLLGLSDTRKEIVFMVSDKMLAYDTLEKLNNDFNFSKPNHGIAFATSVLSLFGAIGNFHNPTETRGVDRTMHKVIWTIVDIGKAETVIDAAKKAGSKGGTIIHARGSGIHETKMLFSMEIEPRKEIVMILAEAKIADSIVSSIREQLEIDKPGAGIIFVQDVNKTYGLHIS